MPMATAKEVIAKAKAEVGYCRFDDPESGTKYMRWLAELKHAAWMKENGQPFCAAFVSWVLAQCGQSLPGTPTAACGDLRNANRGTRRDVGRHNGRLGDIMNFRWDENVDDFSYSDHTGFCIEKDGNYYITCEGNTTGADGRSGSVAIRRRHVKYVQMIIRPDYDGSSSASKPSTPDGKIEVDGIWGEDTTLGLQKVLKATYKDGAISRQNPQHKSRLKACTSGWEFVAPDGEKPGSQTIKLAQKAWGMPVEKCDGFMGPESIEYMIDYYMGLGSEATVNDRRLDYPSPTVAKMQERINQGKI